MPLSLDGFKLINAVFELRYAQQFLVWDRSGTIWSEVAHSYPTIVTKQAQPNAVAVTLAPKLDGLIGFDRASLQSTSANARLDELKAAAAVVVPALVTHLTIEQFTRIGLRLQYDRMFATRKDAADYLARSIALPIPSRRLLNVEGHILEPQFSYKFEGDKLGFLLKIAATQTSINWEVPPEYLHLAPPSKQLIQDRVSIDIDYYSHAMLPVDGLKPDDLIENWLSVIKRDIGHAIT